MRRIMILCVAGALLLFAGCNQTGDTAQASSAISEVLSMTSSMVTSSDVSQASSTAVSETPSTVSSAKSTTSKAVTTQAAITPESSAPASSSTPAPKTIALNVPTTNSAGTLTFTSARVDYENKAVELNYSLNIPSPTFKLNPILDSASTKSVDKVGSNLKSGSSWLKGQHGDQGYQGTGQLGFYGFSDPSDISSITVTYKFKETDPVTVKIDLPGV